MESEKRKVKLQTALAKYLKEPVRLIVTDNTHVFLNALFRKKTWHIRLHWMFLKAPQNVWRHVARYLSTHDRASSKIIDRYIEDHWHWVRHPLPPIRTKGKVYDLQKIFDRLNRRYFKNEVEAKITWGQSIARRSYEQIQMGSFSTSRKLITIHPNLDQKFVPPFVVEATVFHEICHAMIPVKTVRERKQLHPPAFKALESQYQHLKKATTWEEKNINRLLRKASSEP